MVLGARVAELYFADAMNFAYRNQTVFLTVALNMGGKTTLNRYRYKVGISRAGQINARASL